MAKVDLHVHSCFSEHPSEWFLQRIGTRESYVDPEEIYKKAKSEGMDFVTVTDHNVIEGAVRLKMRHPDDVFIGVEVTTYFPEDGTKIHVLVWGLSEGQFRVIDKIRTSIYELRTYLHEEHLAHSVAHATFSINGTLDIGHVERLFLLFDNFETLNGSRDRIDTEILTQVLRSLGPEKISDLSDRYVINSLSDDPWRKGMTGGSDDHSGLFIGRTYTYADAAFVEGFIDCIKKRNVRAAGRQNDYQALAFAVYKVAYDFSKTRAPMTGTIFNTINTLIFEEKPLDLKKRIIFNRMKSKKQEDPVRAILFKLIETLQENRSYSSEVKMTMVCDAAAEASDGLLRGLLEKIGADARDGDLFSLVKSVSGVLPGVFLSLPFFTSLNVMHRSRWLLDSLSEAYVSADKRRKKRIMWFTDTFLEMSGVCATLQELATLAQKHEYDLMMATCIPSDHKESPDAMYDVLDLPCIHEYTPEFFRTFTLRVPSVLSSIEIISKAAPDEIYISTPGPIGLLGVLASKLLHVPCTAVYHTDFTRQARQILGDETVCRLTEEYINWFHSQTDSVAVSTKGYMDLLERRWLNRLKMKPFRRGIDPDLFAPTTDGQAYLASRFGIKDGVTLLHCGRVSKEKNVDFLAEVYEALIAENPDVNLIMAGNGPYLEEYQSKMAGFPRVYFAGRQHRRELPRLYGSCDMLVFPSVTETFGLVVLEAQACGLPAIVSNFGGPQEILINEKTGFIAEANNREDWKIKIQKIMMMIASYPELYQEMRFNSRNNAVENYNWDLVLKDIFARTPGESLASQQGRVSYNPFGDIFFQERHARV